MTKGLVFTLAAASLLAGTGCADSPFKLNTRKDTDALVVTIGDKEGTKVNVDYYRCDPADLQAVLNRYGMRFPKRAVTLELPDNPDPRIEVSVTQMVRAAGLGEIAVLEGKEMRGNFRSRPSRDKILEKPAAPVEPVAVAPAPAPVPAPIAAEPAAPVAEPAAPAPVAAAPAPVAAAPAPVAAAPAPAPVAKQAQNAVTVLAKDNGEFLVNGTLTVSGEQLHAALAKIGKTSPKLPIYYTREPAAPADSPLRIYRAAQNTGLGRVVAK